MDADVDAFHVYCDFIWNAEILVEIIRDRAIAFHLITVVGAPVDLQNPTKCGHSVLMAQRMNSG